MTKALALFQRTPILVLLFLEVINFRTMCAILNLCYVKKLGVDLSEDSDRAAWTGKVRLMIDEILQHYSSDCFLINFSLNLTCSFIPW